MFKKWMALAATALMALTLVVPMVGAQDGGNVFTNVYEQVSPSVVAINVTAERSGPIPFDLPDNFDIPDDIPQQGLGSGFVIDTEGHIVTNNHVVEGATEIEVNFIDGTIVSAEIVGLDPDSDLAVIRVDLPAEQLRPLEFANTDDLLVGQEVLAIGSPFGQRWTLTAGIISALDRRIPGLEQFAIGGVIQTDAPINPGNSGGPLLDLQGRVIGVNAQIRSQSGSNSGVGFAIPGNLTQRVAQQLIADGFVQYSYLGIGGGDITLSIIEAMDLPNNQRGIVVGNVVPGGPADRGGFESAVTDDDSGDLLEVDIITGIDGTPINNFGELIDYLAERTSPGDEVTFSVLRNGTEAVELNVRLAPRPSNDES